MSNHWSETCCEFLLGICNYCIIMVFLVGAFIFNVVNVGIGMSYPNATCYETQNLVSLSTWIQVINLVTLFCVLVTFIAFVLTINRKHAFNCWTALPYVGMISMPLIASICLNIIGIIEIGHQYYFCVKEVPKVAALSIATVIVNIIIYAIIGAVLRIMFHKKEGAYMELF